MRRAGNTAQREIPLERKIEFLRQPGSYAPPCARVDAIETHMSWVFLTEHQAYKLKKPIVHDSADFRTLSARRRNCEEEVRLNRRLAPEVYLGVVPLGLDWRGQLTLNRHAEPVDWLVHMRRLPQRDMLDHAMRDLRVSITDVVRIARRLAQFYCDASREPLPLPEFLSRLEHEITFNRQVLCDPAYPLDIESNARLCAAQQRELQALGAQFGARLDNGIIVEGHGDLNRPGIRGGQLV